ncbi:MAG: hypothetical protein ACJ0BO_00600 [Candidatus Puniceispirillaceae bacterium]
MSNLVLLSENPSFIAVATGVSLLLLFLGFVGFHLLKKVSRLEADIKKSRIDGANTLDELLKLNTSWNAWIKNFERVESRHDQIIGMVEQVRFEQELLTKTVGSENKLSKAIEFARAGSSVDEIVKRTGISVDEATAVARFHGPVDSGQFTENQ